VRQSGYLLGREHRRCHVLVGGAGAHGGRFARFRPGVEGRIRGRCVDPSSIAPNKAAFTVLLSGSWPP
jgi:hypothetical protein